jgi:hypothetical protein
MLRIGRDREVMGDSVSGTLHSVLCLAAIALLGLSVAALALLTLA